MTGHHGVLGDRDEPGPFLDLGRVNFAGDHADIDHVGQRVGDAFAGAARRNIDTDIGVKLTEFLGPFHHHGIKGEGAGDGDRALQILPDFFLGRQGLGGEQPKNETEG